MTHGRTVEQVRAHAQNAVSADLNPARQECTSYNVVWKQSASIPDALQDRGSPINFKMHCFIEHSKLCYYPQILKNYIVFFCL